MSSLGVTVKKSSTKEASVQRITAETTVEVEVSIKPKEANVSTGYNFLDHMIESIARWGCISIKITLEANKPLSHMIAEDAGITVGLALQNLSKKRIEELGIEGIGFAHAPIDEALSEAIVSIEGRSNTYIESKCEGSKTDQVEDLSPKDLVAFIEGLSQGWGATIHVRVLKGVDPHHSWESAFRALGIAISSSLKENPSRKGAIPGLKSYFGV